MNIYIHTHIYIYLYIERERERETGSLVRDQGTPETFEAAAWTILWKHVKYLPPRAHRTQVLLKESRKSPRSGQKEPDNRHWSLQAPRLKSIRKRRALNSTSPHPEAPFWVRGRRGDAAPGVVSICPEIVSKDAETQLCRPKRTNKQTPTQAPYRFSLPYCIEP